MTAPPLCIIQARYGSTRLSGKMLLTIGTETLIARAWRIASEAFGSGHCVVAIPATDEAGPLGGELRRIGATVFLWTGAVDDVLARFHACAHAHRWQPESVIVRYTPDDPHKSVEGLQRVAQGERMAVEIGGEAFTLAMLDTAHHEIPEHDNRREHITHAIFQTAPPRPPAGVWSIDTQEDLDVVRAKEAKPPWPEKSPKAKR